MARCASLGGDRATERAWHASCCPRLRAIPSFSSEDALPQVSPPSVAGRRTPSRAGSGSSTQRGTCWQSRTPYWGLGRPAESSRGGRPGELLPAGEQSWVLWRWDEFPGRLWPTMLTQGASGWRTRGSAKMDASEKSCGRWSDTWRLLLTSPALFRLAAPVSSVFLTRTPSRRTAHTEGGRGPGGGGRFRSACFPSARPPVTPGQRCSCKRCGALPASPPECDGLEGRCCPLPPTSSC